MQESVQVEKEYSFEEIVPDWNDIIAQNGGFMECKNSVFEDSDGKQRTLSDPDCCIMGEAHG